MHWRHRGSPCRECAESDLCTVFWDRRNILLVDFLTRVEAVNAERYCETLQELRRAIQDKRRGILWANVILVAR